MSWQLKILNFVLRHTELKTLRNLRQEDIPKARKRLDFAARFLIPTPRGVRFEPVTLSFEGREIAGKQALTGASGATTLLYFHGGGYFIGSPDSHKKLAGEIAQQAGLARAILPQYRLAPEHIFPAALDDAFDAYRALLETGLEADTIVIGGDSAGGGLALALLGRICQEELARPSCLFALSPWTDLSGQGGSLRGNLDTEVMLPAERMGETAAAYLGDKDATDPGASPLFAEFANAPPVLILVSDSEILQDDALGMAAALKQQGNMCQTRVSHNLPHVWPFFNALLPEGKVAIQDVAAFIKANLSRVN